VELLTVVVIISMLAGMSLLALTGTMTAAKESKTRGTITKLNTAILDIFESYQERFDNISINPGDLTTAGVVANDRNCALAKLHFIHDIMRMEMPFKWEEITHNTDQLSPVTTQLNNEFTGLIRIGNYHILDRAPPVTIYYRTALKSILTGWDAVTGRPLVNSQSPSSELLFLIIANLNPEALENFHGSEIGDIDNNGLREFHDAWGHPIHFIRFAPAFTGSDLQPDVITASNYPLSGTADNTTNWVNPVTIPNDASGQPDTSGLTLTSLQQDLFVSMMNNRYPDPFDPNGHINRSWFLYPLIVSGGADGLVDLYFDINLPPSVSIANPLTDIFCPTRTALGIPYDTDTMNGVLNHYDNIHNHRSSNSF
jgi:hypothetical protein